MGNEVVERKSLTTEEAIKMLPDDDYIHTFRVGGMMMIGADWPRASIVEAFDKFGVELSGSVATAMEHGLCFNDGGWVFVATRTIKEGGE